MQSFHERLGFRLADGFAQLGGLAANAFLDRVDRGNALDDFLGEGRPRRLEHTDDRPAGHPEAGELRRDLLLAAPACEDIGDGLGGAGPAQGRSSVACAQNWLVFTRPGASTGIGVSSQNRRGQRCIVASCNS